MKILEAFSQVMGKWLPQTSKREIFRTVKGIRVCGNAEQLGSGQSHEGPERNAAKGPAYQAEPGKAALQTANARVPALNVTSPSLHYINRFKGVR